MKKQLRLVLFAVLVMVLIVASALVASAVTEGSIEPENGHYYQVHTGPRDRQPKYYSTLEKAIASIEADGYTITVLQKATEQAIVLDADYAYTIKTPAGARVTINVISLNSDGSLISATAGKITFSGINFAYADSQVSGTPASVINLNGATELTLTDVKSTAAVGTTVLVSAPATVTVNGDATDVSGATNFLKTAVAGATLNVAGGKLAANEATIALPYAATVNVTGGVLNAVNSVAIEAVGGSTVTVSGGTMKSVSGQTLFALTGANTVKLEAGAKIVADNAYVFGALPAAAAVELNGVEFTLAGANAAIFSTATLECTVTTTAATVYLQDGANYPAATLALDYSKIAVGISELKLTTGTLTFNSADDIAALVAANIPAHITNLVPGWIPVVIDGADAVLNIAGGTYTATGSYLFVVKNGTLNLQGGTLNGSANSAIVVIEGGVVNYTGTTMNAGANGKTFDVVGGTLSVEGTGVRLPEHKYSMVAAAGGEVKYYTSMAAALNAITADGAIITVFESVSDTAWVLDADYAYTITGNATVTFTSTVTAGKKAAISVTAGTPVIEGLTFDYSSVTPDTLFAAKADLTVKNITVNSAFDIVFYMNAAVKLTITGEQTVINNGKDSAATVVHFNVVGGEILVEGGQFTSGGSFIYFYKGATATITGGTATCAADSVFKTSRNAKPINIKVSNATLTSGTKSSLIMSSNGAEFSIELLAGADITVQDAPVFAPNKNSSVVWKGARITIIGAESVLAKDADFSGDTPKLTFSTVESGTLVLGRGATIPSTALDAVIDWSKIAIEFTEYEATYAITEAGVYVFNSLDEYLAIAQAGALANFANEYLTRFPLAKLEMAGWIPLTIDHADAQVTIVSGDYYSTGSYVFTLKAGTLNIRNANITAAKGAFVVMEGGTLNIIAGTITGSDGSKMIEHKAGTINVTGGTINAGLAKESYIIYTTAAVGNDINISGGTLNGGIVICVAEEATNTVNYTGGLINHRDGAAASVGVQLFSANSTLNISGGEMKNMNMVIHATNGAVNITGGSLKNDANGSHVFNVDGPVKVNISGGELILMTVLDDIGAINISPNAALAEIDISGGGFGGPDGTGRNYMNPINVHAPIQHLNVTGGRFIGGRSGGGVVVRADAKGAVLNFSGDCLVGAYRSFYVLAECTLNISGGTITKRPYSDQQNYIAVHCTQAATINVSGGHFTEIMIGFYLAGAAELNITGGVFDTRTLHENSGEGVYAIFRVTAAAKVNVGANENGGADPVFNLKRSATKDGKTIQDLKGFVVTNASASIKLAAGAYNIENANNIWFDFPAAGLEAFEIAGGTFSVVGEGASFIPASMDKVGTKISGATVRISGGAGLPVYNNIDTTTLHIIFEGAITNDLIIRKPFAGDDPDGNGYVLSTPADLYNLVAGQFASFVADPSAFSTWLPMLIDGDGVVVTFLNVNDVYDMASMVKVNNGTLKVIGGQYTANAGEKLFEITGNATLVIQGGEFNVSGAGSYLIYIAEGKTPTISVTDAKMTVGMLGNVPLQVDFNVTAQAVTVTGMSEIMLTQSGTYDIFSVTDITTLVQAALAEKFTTGLTVDIQTWVPLHMNNKDLTINIKGGVYEASAPFMIKVTAGALNITGGKFTNTAGDIIHVTGKDAVVLINLPNSGAEETNGMYTTGRIVYAKNAVDASKGATISINNGRFVELSYDATGDQKDALFVFEGDVDTEARIAFTIKNGYFKATRVLLLYYAPVTAVIENGTFVSNVVLDGVTIKTRPSNAHMLSPRGARATLTIRGGNFDNKQGNYVLAQNGGGGATTTINGGVFNGGCGWYFSNYDTTLTINGGIFTDTEGYANAHYIYLNETTAGAAKVNINGGTFTGTVGTADIFHATGGQFVIADGTFTGSLFHITTNSFITVSGGTYKATGAGSVLFEFVDNGNTSPNATNFYLATAIQFKAENYASVISVDKMSTLALQTVLSKATYYLDGSVRLGVTVAINADEVWETPAAAKHFITDFFGASKVTFGPNDGVYALQLRGNYTITIKGGDYQFPGATLFKLYGVDLVIEDGSFYASEGGDVLYLEGASSITIGQEYSPAVKPLFVVGKGGNIIHANGVSGKILIYNASFYKGSLNTDGSVTPMIDYTNAISPLFYFENGGDLELFICDGYYEATRILQDNQAYADIIICGGVFKSNLDKQNIADIYGADVQYDSKNGPVIYDADNGAILYDSAQSDLFFTRGYATVTIYGGTFNGAYNRSIFAVTDEGGTTFNFYGGEYTGGYNWFYTNQKITLNMAEKQNPWNEVIGSPAFRGPDNFTRYGFYLDVNEADKHIDLTISAGSYSMTGNYDRYMFVLKGDIDVNVSGGSFVVNPGSRRGTNGELQNDTMIFTSYATTADLWADITITGGSFTAARIVFISKGRAHLVIEDGKFTSNSESIENAHFFYLNYTASTIYISGGTFTGNKYQYHHFYATGSSGLEITIVGGTFSKGLRWGYLSSAGMKFTVGSTATTSPTFNDLSDGAGVDIDSNGKSANVTVYGIYIHRNCSGAEILFDNATFELPATTKCTAMFVVEGGNMTFGPGMKVEHPNRIFQITNAFIGNITFTGGTYTATSICNMFYITVTMANAQKNGGTAEARILIKDGTFRALENATMFHLLSQVPQYMIQITGGTFFSESARMFFYDGTGMTVTIEDGDFSSTGARMIYMDNNTTPLYILGGTFTFLERSGNNTDNGLIYAVGKNPSVVTIKGGTFIDNRSGNKQTFIKMNPKAVINFEGGFKMYVKEKKANFFYDFDNNANSLPITQYAAVENLNGQDYYVCFGYYREYGPKMTTTPMLRAIVGQEGITYSATIPAATIEYLQGLGTLSYGMLIFPTEYLNNGEWNTETDFLAELKAYAAESGKAEGTVYVDIVADKGKAIADNGDVTYYASLINIKEANYTRAFTGIAYTKVVNAEGVATYHYATHVSASVTQDMRSIAKAAMTDLDTKPWDNNGRVYCYATIMKEGMYFCRYSPAQQDSLRKYLAESDRMPKHKK